MTTHFYHVTSTTHIFHLEKIEIVMACSLNSSSAKKLTYFLGPLLNQKFYFFHKRYFILLNRIDPTPTYIHLLIRILTHIKIKL